jgi:peptide deformylase
MAKLPIIEYPNPILLKKSAKIKDPKDKKIQKMIADMLETMKIANGLGLAAPQIGKSLRLCVIEDQGETYILINPKITSLSRKKIAMEEGCLSFPGDFFSISRPEKVQIRYLDKEGAKVKLKADGLLARALQHEIDHLDGILFITRVKKNK